MRNHGEKSTRKSACDPKGTQATPPTIAISALICHFVFVLFVSACKNIVFCLYSQTFVCFSFKKVSESSVFGTFLMSTSFRQSRCSVVLLMCGLRSGYAERFGGMSVNLRMFLAVGFCGGFTTFSTFMNENVGLIKADASFSMLIYLAGSLVG